MRGVTLHPSPYLCMADQEFRDGRGREVVPVYKTDEAALLLLPTGLAEALARPEIDPAALDHGQLRELVALGLVGEDPQAFREAHYRRLTEGPAARRASRTFVLLPTSYCNMGCAYCGQVHKKQSLGGDHRAAVLERIFYAMEDARTHEVSVGWFGGEPLMAYATIRAMSREIVRKAAECGVTYTASLTTNGSLLDARKLRVLTADCGVGRFDITLDGPARVHDAHRPLKNGRGSFERLVDVLSDAVSAEEFRDVTFVLRTNVDVANCAHVAEYLRLMADRGFSGARNVVFQLSPIHTWGKDIEAIRVAKEDVARREIEWFSLMTELGLTFAAVPTSVVEVTCAAVTRTTEVVEADGSVFSCTEHPLVPEHEQRSVLIPLSSLRPDELRPPGQFDDWPGRVARRETQCSTCWLLPVCGGSCPKLWDEGEIACPSMKENMPQRLSLVARAKGFEPTGRQFVA